MDELLKQTFGTGAAITDPATIAGEGYQPIFRGRESARHRQRVFGALQMWREFQEGGVDPFYIRQAFSPTDSGAWSTLCRRFPAVFRETMTTSDFSALTLDVLDRELLADYTEMPSAIEQIAKQATLRDFRYKKVFIMDGLETPFGAVGEMEDLPLGDLSQRAPILYSPLKYEKGARMSWEAAINDDLGILQDIPRRLARAARRTRSKFITGLYSSATGPSTSLYTSGFANQITIANGASSNNPPLSIQGLGDAFTVLGLQVDTGGDPIEVTGDVFLVVPPQLKVTANNLMHQLSVDVNVAGGTTQSAPGAPTTTIYNAQRVRVDNWIVDNLTVIVDSYLPIVTTSAGVKATQWYIFQNPAGQGRPALEMGSLAGFSTPGLYQKVPNTMRVGGGLEPMLGDFQTMSQEFKALMAFGGTILDGRSTVASTGQGV